MAMGKQKKSTIKTLLYVRVSTKGQQTDRQEHDLVQAAEAKGWEVIGTVRETISGASKNAQRKGLQELLQLARAGAIDKAMVQEVSRLGRSTSEVLKVVEELTELKVSIYVQNFNLETLDAKGKRNPTAQFMFTMLAEFARMEREYLRERIYSGLERARRQGKTLGRPKGSTISDEDVLRRYPKVTRELRAGMSIRKTAKICNVAAGTVQKVKAIMMAKVRKNGSA